MLKNYKIDEHGVMHQIDFKIIDYNVNYVALSYDTYGELNRRMSCLRLGYILGVIGRLPDSLLDVGYGNGDFLKLCSENIEKCYGNDISGYKIPEKCEFIQDIFSRKFDVITFFDVLEHFGDIDFVKNLNANYVVISLPWCHNLSDEWFENWKHRKENEHLHHFNAEALVNFMNYSGFDCLNISNVEDIIRKPVDQNKNILTGVFKKRV